MEGTRDGSRIRIVDEETGEIFFRRISKSRPKDYSDGNQQDDLSSELRTANIVQYVETPKSYNKLDMQQSTEDVGDILVLNSEENLRRLPKRVKQSLNPFEDQSDEEDEEQETSSKLPSPKGRSRTKIQFVLQSSDSARGILKKSPTCENQIDENFNTVNNHRLSSQSRIKRKVKPPSRRDSESELEVNNVRTKKSSSKSPIKQQLKQDLNENIVEPVAPLVDKRGPKIGKTSKRSASPKRSLISSKTEITELPNRVIRRIFHYLKREDLRSCNRVCYKWKCLTDLALTRPCVFEGKSFYGHYYSEIKCQEFLKFLLDLEPRIPHPVELHLNRMCHSQLKAILLDVNFKQAVRHIESLSLIGCSFKWKLWMGMMKNFSKLRILSDVKSVYYSRAGNPICGYRQHTKKEVSRKEFQELKDSLKSLRSINIKRDTVTYELPVYLTLLTQGTRYVEDLEIVLGPYETLSSQNDTKFCNLLNYFVKELRALINKNRDTLRTMRFSWSDKNFTGYFTTCLESLDKLKLKKLQTLSLQFDKHSMTGKGASSLRDFLDYHYARSLCNFKLDRMMLSESWMTTSEFLDELVETIPPCCAGLCFKVLISDANPLKMAVVHQIIRLDVFRRFISDIHFSIENETTKSISQLFGKEWHRKSSYPRVRKVVVTFEPAEPIRTYNQFTCFNIDLISNVFPNLTELRISDKLVDHNKIFTQVFGRPRKFGVSNGQLDNKDIQLISKFLYKLRVLRLWVNMRTVDDHGMTGIHRGDISILHEDNEHFSWGNFHHDVLPSFSNLKMLRELSLRGLGPTITDITLKFGFQNLSKLKVLELHGKLSVTRRGRIELRKRMKNNEEGTFVNIKYQLE